MSKKSGIRKAWRQAKSDGYISREELIDIVDKSVDLQLSGASDRRIKKAEVIVDKALDHFVETNTFEVIKEVTKEVEVIKEVEKEVEVIKTVSGGTNTVYVDVPGETVYVDVPGETVTEYVNEDAFWAGAESVNANTGFSYRWTLGDTVLTESGESFVTGGEVVSAHLVATDIELPRNLLFVDLIDQPQIALDGDKYVNAKSSVSGEAILEKDPISLEFKDASKTYLVLENNITGQAVTQEVTDMTRRDDIFWGSTITPTGREYIGTSAPPVFEVADGLLLGIADSPDYDTFTPDSVIDFKLTSSSGETWDVLTGVPLSSGVDYDDSSLQWKIFSGPNPATVAGSRSDIPGYDTQTTADYMDLVRTIVPTLEVDETLRLTAHVDGAEIPTASPSFLTAETVFAAPAVS